MELKNAKSVEDKEINVENACRMIEEAADSGADIICLPEFFNVGAEWILDRLSTEDKDRIYNAMSLVEPVNGYTNNKLLKISKEKQIYIIGGSLPTRVGKKIYNMGPTFRAEKSKTSRHLSEFWMAEMEAAWMDLDDIIEIGKEEIRFILKQVLKHNKNELEILNQNFDKLKKISESEFPTITYTEAIDILNDKENMNVQWGKDLRTLEENKLASHFETPVAVTNYPVEIMAFYKPRDPKDPKTALCFDMIAPDGYGEIIGGSQRSLDIEDMVSRLEDMGEKVDNYKWYFDLRRYGSVPHSGYGLGVERVVAWICGIDNIKDTIPFPRTLLRFRP